jgi:hypothetical protein
VNYNPRSAGAVEAAMCFLLSQVSQKDGPSLAGMGSIASLVYIDGGMYDL